MLDAADSSYGCADRVDYMEAGAGPLVVLIHSSMAGARQWSPLIRDLEDRFLVRAVNLFGYGETPTWSKEHPPSLDDYADLVARVIPRTARDISLVGHSFGGAVAMQAAAHQLRARAKRLVLIEPSPFYLLDYSDRREAYNEISLLAKYTLRCVREGNPEAAAERFIDYWCGPGTWAASSSDRRSAFVRSIVLLPNEWNAVLRGHAAAEEWTAALPQDTLVMCSATTVRPSRELADLLSHARPDWGFVTVCDGGHMAPLTHPNVVNPVVRDFLTPRRVA